MQDKVRKKFSIKETGRILKTKTLMFSMWDCENDKSWPHQHVYLVIKKLFKETILFDPRKKRFEYGPEGMKERFISLIKKKKPDYLILMVGSNELNIDTIELINKVSPKTKVIADFGDDDIDFEIFSRYYALFLDYYLIGQPQYIPQYKKEGFKNAFSRLATNTVDHRPMKVKKEYDVSFVGTPLAPRVETLKLLIKNGIKVKLWGRGWNNYPEFKSIYGGTLTTEEVVEVVNKSKITLGLSKNRYGEPHFALRVFRVGACKAFQLVDYFPEYTKYLDKDKEIVMFKGDEDLLRKIEYYLKHVKEREKIAGRAYKKIISTLSMENVLKELFRKTLEDEKGFSRKRLPRLEKKIIQLSGEDLYLSLRDIKEKLKGFDYVCFSHGKCTINKHRNYLLSYALEKTKKEIGCCDYQIVYKELGDFMTFKTGRCLKNLEKDSFNRLLNINQIVLSKKYFLKNLGKIKGIFSGREIDFVEEKNTAFISIPLVEVNELNRNGRECINKLDNHSMEKAYQLGFMVRLYILLHRKKILFNSYPYKLIINSLLRGDMFVFRYLLGSTLNKENWFRIKNRG